MAKPVLPEIFREEIKSLLKKGYTQDAVFKFVEKSTESEEIFSGISAFQKKSLDKVWTK